MKGVILSMDRIAEKIKKMGYHLRKEDYSKSKYVPVKIVGNLAFVSGYGSTGQNGKLLYVGRVGAEVNLEQAYECARQCAINSLSGLKQTIANLERVDEIVKVLGFVNSAEDFYRQPEVMHGFTDFMIEVFGEKGRHARSAIGTSNLPNNQPVEVEMIVKLKDPQ